MNHRPMRDPLAERVLLDWSQRLTRMRRGPHTEAHGYVTAAQAALRKAEQ